MSILEGAYWISFREPRKSLKADADGSVWGVNPGPRGIDVLDSAALRTRIWLAEKATDGQSFRFRNYETGSSLDSGDQGHDSVSRVVATRGCTEGQLWDVVPLRDLTAGPTYQIKNMATSTVLGQSKITEGRCRITLNTSNSEQREGWLIEPVLLPTLYSITNISHTLMLCAPIHPNASDGISGAVKLVSSDQLTRNHLWMLEYVSLNEAIVRSASHNQFVLDLASDSHMVLARKYHGRPSQRWTVKYASEENEETLSLVNTKTGTLLAIQQREVSKYRRLNRLVSVPDGATQWRIQSYPQPPLFWVSIQDPSGAQIAQVDDEPLMLYEGPLSTNDHTTQWRFIMIGDGLEYVIENRATGFMFGADATTDRDNTSSHWMLSSSEPSSFKLINTASKKLVFRGREATITTQPAGFEAYDSTPSGSIPCQICDWQLKPAYDNLPSFAIVNSYTGRCVSNDPATDIGTISITNNFNDFRSQWQFHARRASVMSNDLTCLLSNKMSGNSLEGCFREEVCLDAYNDNRQNTIVDPNSIWRLLPLSTDLLALCMHFGPGFLYDPGNSNPEAQDLPADIRSLYWYLISHRESGFDFMSSAFSTTEQMVEHISSKPSETPWDAIQRYLDAKRKSPKQPDPILKWIPLSGNAPNTTDAIVRVALASLIAQWTEDSIPQKSAPHTIISSTREEIEERWGVCLTRRALRLSVDHHTWIRIDLQGIYDVGGTWVASIQGQWLDTPVFRVTVPVEIQVGYVVIQRAMLHSLDKGFAVQVRTTPLSPGAVPSGNTRPDLIRQRDSTSYTSQPTKPWEPTQPKTSGYYSYGYSDQYYRQQEQYERALAVYNSELTIYNGDIFWKLRSAEMRFINQLIA